VSRDMGPLYEDIRRAHAADPGGPLFNQLVADTARAIDRGEVTEVSKQSKADSEGYAAINGVVYLGSALSGGSGKVARGTNVGRKGRGQVPATAKEIRAAKKVVAAEKKAAAQEIRANRAAARKARRG